MIKTEEGELSAFVLEAMLENWQAAREDRRPMCADSGLPRFYVIWLAACSIVSALIII